jgi:hypothetical protein
LKLIQTFGFAVAVLGFGSALIAALHLVFPETGWTVTWAVIPIGVVAGVLGLALAWLAQTIWDIVQYIVSL